jgi:hypothetical protein
MKKTAVILAVIMIFAASVSAANKIRWKDMNWKIYETENFRVFYYEGAELLAKIAAVYAEEALFENTRILNYVSKTKIPLFVYENRVDFTSTNITLSSLPREPRDLRKLLKTGL